MDFDQWWQVMQVTDRKGNPKEKHLYLLREDVYAFGLHYEHYDIENTTLNWEVWRREGEFAVWDYFYTSQLERIEETETGLVAYTKNSVYYLDKVDPPEMPEGEGMTEDEWIDAQIAKGEAEAAAAPVLVEASTLGKLLLSRKQNKEYQFSDRYEIWSHWHRLRKVRLGTDFSMIDLINEASDPEACRQKLAETLTDYAVAFREAEHKDPEQDLYATFFDYATLLFCNTNLPDSGIDDVISLAEYFMRDVGAIGIVFEENLVMPDKSYHVAAFKDWINDSEFHVPRNFDEYVQAAVAAFVGSLAEPPAA